jgi:methylmalonyl-CoA epimerase
MFKEVDHIAIVVRNTEEALAFYRDTLKLPLKVCEEVPDVGVRLTHLDMGNLDLQLVEPLSPEHPLSLYLDEHGESLHHICWKMPDVGEAVDKLESFGLEPRSPNLHSGVCGKKAAFVDPASTRGVLWEMTSG